MMIEGNPEIKNVFTADVASSLLENPHCLKDKQQRGRKQEYTFTGTPYHAGEKCWVQKKQPKSGVIKCQL